MDIETVINNLYKEHQKRQDILDKRMILVFLITFSLVSINEYFYQLNNWIMGPAVIICFGLQFWCFSYKLQVDEPLVLLDKFQQLKIFNLACQSKHHFVLILRPRFPSAFSMSAERQHGTGSGLSGVPHPISQPSSHYSHGWTMYQNFERMLPNDLYFICLGDIYQSHSLVPLTRTLFLKSEFQNWTKTIKILIKNAKLIIYVPDISEGMVTELDEIIETEALSKCAFYFPISTNPNRDQKRDFENWMNISEIIRKKGINLPEKLNLIEGKFLIMAAEKKMRSIVNINDFFYKRCYTNPCNDSGQVLKQLVDEKLIITTHHEEVYKDKMYQQLLTEQ